MPDSKDSFQLRIFIPGDQALQLNRVLVGLGDDVRDWRPAFDDIATEIEAGAVEQFRSQGARGGRPWAPLTPAYAAAKERRWGRRPILIASGRGYGAVVNRYDSNHVRRLEPMEMAVGADDAAVPYMKFHQSGTRNNFQRDEPVAASETFTPTGSIEVYRRNRGRGMPRRRPLVLIKADRKAIMRRMHEHARRSRQLQEVLSSRYAAAAEARDEP